MQVKTTFAGGVVPAWAKVPVVESAPPVLKPRKTQLRTLRKFENMDRVFGAMKGGHHLTRAEVCARLEMTDTQVKEAALRLMMNGKLKQLTVYVVNKGV